MTAFTYYERRAHLKTYFDRTAVDAWARLTTDAPVSGIRATVRAGRDRMRHTLLGWLPEDLHGRRILDAGAGTGAFAVEAARRGADVVAIDLSPKLIELARSRAPGDLGSGSIEFRSGDMLDASLGHFDHVVCMDSLVHYVAPDMVAAAARLAERTSHSVLFTFAPKTPALAVMHTVGRLFPRGDRAPAIEPVTPPRLLGLLGEESRLAGWSAGRTNRISHGFYMSQAMELVRR